MVPWAAHFLTLILTLLHVTFPKEYYLFRGAPDILIQPNCALLGASLSQDDLDRDLSSEEDEAIENSFQQPPLKGYTDYYPPEKLGELFAALHCLLVSKVLQKVSKGKNLGEIQVKGLLLDKVLGGATAAFQQICQLHQLK